MGSNYSRLFVALAIAFFIVLISAVGFWKYAFYRYQGFDLAIYTNVLWNLSHGYGWWSSIQANSYLGDHFEPILLFLVPLFRLWPDPRLLIIVQTLALGLAAVPVYLLLKISNTKQWKFEVSRPAALAGLWLLNPLLWNAALFEFHALSFLPLFVLSAAYAYLRQRFGWFILFLLLTLSVREDAALIVAMFGVVAFFDWLRARKIQPIKWSPTAKAVVPVERPVWGGIRRCTTPTKVGVSFGGLKLAWIITPVVLGLIWFIVASRVTASHNLAGHYKYLVFYGWLARFDFFGHQLTDFAAVLWGMISRPLTVLGHILTIGNLDMLLGLLMPFVFLPLLRPRWLLLTLPPLLQIILSGGGGNELVLNLHYSLLFIAGLILASIEGLAAWSASPKPWLRCWIERQLPNFPRAAALGLTLFWMVAVTVLLGPFPGVARVFVRGASMEDRDRRAAYEEIMKIIPPDASVAASCAALPHAATRHEAVNLEYVYLGVTQFAEKEYEPPPSVEYLIMDARDARAYAVQFKNVGWAAPTASGGANRLRRLVTERNFRVIAERNGVALLQRDANGSWPADHYFKTNDPVRGALMIDDLRDVRIQEPAPGFDN